MQVTGTSLVVTITLLGIVGPVNTQQAGRYENEEGPKITVKECTVAGGCISKRKKVTLDANWRWIHKTSGYENCYTGNQWDKSVCDQDGARCAQQCAVEGITKEKYSSTYGVSEIQDGVKLKFVTEHQYGVNVGSRLYILEDDNRYYMFQLKNREFALDIDVSNLHCGMNGAMYFVEMDQDGGKGLGQNQAGAKYGTGYCDAQCPHDIKFINGEANCKGWVSNPLDQSNNMGIGHYGSCCAEMDIWEANSMATAYTPHPCSINGQLQCEGTQCGDNDKDERYKGVCDKDGCDINPFRMGNENFYGKGNFTIDTTKPMTVVTQFLTTDGTDDGDLSEIRRFYVQNGRVIHSPPSTILGPRNSDSITDDFCAAKKELFGDINDFQAKGGNAEMGRSLDRGQVLALSLWDDVEVNMLWLDSAYPLNKPVTSPGVKRGNCPGGESSTPTYVRNNFPDGYVTFANAAIGEICSTTGHCPQPPTPTPAPTPSPTPGLCKPWCSTSPKPWSKKCTWSKCKECSECSVTPTPAPTPSPTPGLCKSWCSGNSRPWSKKCLWEKCRGCPDCTSGVRRLRGSNDKGDSFSNEELLV